MQLITHERSAPEASNFVRRESYLYSGQKVIGLMVMSVYYTHPEHTSRFFILHNSNQCFCVSNKKKPTRVFRILLHLVQLITHERFVPEASNFVDR